MNVADTLDQWARWLLERRHGSDPKRLQEMLAFLYPIRDRVLDHAVLRGEEILLDVGCGDGLIAFGALERLPAGKVIFSDISRDLLSHVQTLAEQMDVLDRTQFVLTSAEDLAPIADQSVDVVTLRSVLIYVEAKQQAFHHFYRVLVPGGRLSLFEPINRFGHPGPAHTLWGFDVRPVQQLAEKVRGIYAARQPASDPMLNFDERDLLQMAEEAGFREIHMDVRFDVLKADPRSSTPWESFIQSAPNPRVPSLEEALHEALSPGEREQFTAHLRPLVESGQGEQRQAVAYLWAHKSAG